MVSSLIHLAGIPANYNTVPVLWCDILLLYDEFFAAGYKKNGNFVGFFQKTCSETQQLSFRRKPECVST